MTNITIPVSTAEIAAIEQAYILTQPSEVLQVLEKQPSLVAILAEAADKIKHYFPECDRYLEVVIDTEIIHQTQLVVFISPKLTPDEAVDRLNEFEDDWWLDAGQPASNKLEIMVEFR